MREEIEVLEEHAGAQPELTDLLVVLAPPCPKRIGLEANAVDLHPAGGGILEEVDAPQQRGLAGAGSADDHHRLPLAHLEVDPAQDMVRPEQLLEPARRGRSARPLVGRGKSGRIHG